MSSIYGSTKSFKCKSGDAVILPLGTLESEGAKTVLAWTVRWVLSVGAQKQIKVATELNATFPMFKGKSDSGKTFVLYRRQMLQLLAYPKPVFDQLAIELPCLMGFRSTEVTSWLAEYIDFQNMNTYVMDSKKKDLFTVPLNLHVAKHAEKVLNGRTEGVLLRSRSNRNLGQQLTKFAIWHIWKKYTKLLPNAVDISPLTGRRFFAAYWYHHLKLSLMTLSKILRHSGPAVTLGYVEKLIFYEDVKSDYNSFQRSIAKDQDKFQFRLMEELQDKKEVYV